MKLNLCITNYNRYELLLNAIKCRTFSWGPHANLTFVEETIITDDTDDNLIGQKLNDWFTNNPGCNYIKNEKRLGMQLNKLEVLRQSSMLNDNFAILLDSDNKLTDWYFIALHNLDWFNHSEAKNIIVAPTFAMPQFDYQILNNLSIDFSVASEILNGGWTEKHKTALELALNTCNYVVHPATFLEKVKPNPDVKGCDTFWFNYQWLKNGGKIFFLKDMHYNHLVHDGSEWLKHADENMRKANEIIKLIIDQK